MEAKKRRYFKKDEVGNRVDCLIIDGKGQSRSIYRDHRRTGLWAERAVACWSR